MVSSDTHAQNMGQYPALLPAASLSRLTYYHRTRLLKLQGNSTARLGLDLTLFTLEQDGSHGFGKQRTLSRIRLVDLNEKTHSTHAQPESTDHCHLDLEIAL